MMILLWKMVSPGPRLGPGDTAAGGACDTLSPGLQAGAAGYTHFSGISPRLMSAALVSRPGKARTLAPLLISSS